MFERMKNDVLLAQRDEDYDWVEGESDLVNFLFFLESENTDLTQYGDEVSMGNFEGGFKLYDCYNDHYYIVPYSDLVKFENKEVVALHPREMDNDERLQYERERGGDDYIWCTRIVTDVLWDGEKQVENDGYNAREVVVYGHEPLDRFAEILKEIGYGFDWDKVTVENNGDIVELFEDGILKAYFMTY